MFIFKGVKNTDLEITCKEENFIGRAARTYEEIHIQGSSVPKLNIENYQNYTCNIELFLYNYKNLDFVLSWLDGVGDFEYNSRKTRAYFLDAVTTENMYEKVIKITCTFIRAPFWKNAEDTKVSPVDVIYNNGNIYSRPVIELEGSGKAAIKINDITFSYDFDDDQRVVIDCEEKTESFNGKSKSKNIHIGFEYPTLLPGKNTVSLEGDVKMFVSRKDSWL